MSRETLYCWQILYNLHKQRIALEAVGKRGCLTKIITLLMEKEGMNLKEGKEEYMRGCGGRKGNGKIM